MAHILLVEDEPRLRKDVADFIELSSFTVTGVATARELREALGYDNPPAVTILDVGLPDGNGFELATEIRRTYACGIIMLTALGDSNDRIRGFDSGADIYLVKHSTLREIEAASAAFCAGQAIRRIHLTALTADGCSTLRIGC